MYATVQDLRDEGVSETEGSSARLEKLLVESSDAIDRITGWNFEPREWTLRFDGSGRYALEPSVMPITLSGLWVNGTRIEVDGFRVVGAPVSPGFLAPRIELRQGVFPYGEGNVIAQGMWGFTEQDGTPLGRVPWSIRRACMLLTMRMLPKLTEHDRLHDARSGWRIVEERTRDQSYALGKLNVDASLTGDPEVDILLRRYMRPMGLGAA